MNTALIATVYRAVAALVEEGETRVTALQICDYIGCDENTPTLVAPLATYGNVRAACDRLLRPSALFDHYLIAG